jgi:hypothetical protein
MAASMTVNLPQRTEPLCIAGGVSSSSVKRNDSVKNTMASS